MATNPHRRRRKVNGRSSPISKLGSDDLLSELLIRLPDFRSAFRCKSVCKRWNSLIFTPEFSRRFLSHHQITSADDGESEQSLMTFSEIRKSILSFLPLPRRHRSKLSVLDSVKDLLLVGFLVPQNDRELCRTYLVCNSFTQQWVALPLAPKTPARPSGDGWIGRLVCEPVNPHGLDLGNGEVLACHLGYRRFRVVRIFDLASASSQLEMFCSETGEWTKLILRLDANLTCCYHGVSVHGDSKLSWLNKQRRVVKWDPFGDGAIPTLIDGSELIDHYAYGPWESDGALHVVSSKPGNSIDLSVWRLEEEEGGRGGWKKQYELTYLEDSIRSIVDSGEVEADELDLEFERVIGLHPEKPEIMFFSCAFYEREQRSAVLSVDMRREELELLTTHRGRRYDQVYQSRVAFWPSPIPSYKNLQNAYNGRYKCWRPSSNP